MSTPTVVAEDDTEERNSQPAEAQQDPVVDDAETPDVSTDSPGSDRGTKRTRSARTFPAASFIESLPLAEAIQRHAAGQRVRRLTLFEHMGRSAESGTSRQLVTNSSQYAITKGSYKAEFLELTQKGALASGDDSLGRAKLAARLQLAIADVAPFNALYEQFKNNRLPATGVLRDFVIEQSLVSEDNGDECIETFLANCRDLGLLTNYAGAERLLTFELLLDGASEPEPEPARVEGRVAAEAFAEPRPLSSPAQVIADTSDLSNVCFLVTPIGEEGSEQRMHADLMLGSLVEPALQGLGMRLVRADRISTPGMITAQVIDHLVRAPLVIADLSFGNPNVFYELALRHASRQPAVQIIRAGDHLPFDVGQFRTVPIDMTSIFTLVPQIDTYRAEIARQCRAALAEKGEAESPLSLFYPRFWDQYKAN